MLTRGLRSVPPRRRAARAEVVFGVLGLLTVCAGSSLQANNAQQRSLPRASPGVELVVLVDVNPHQVRVLPIEQELAGGVVQKLGQPESVFSVIAFGADLPTLLKSRVNADDAVAAIRAVRLGRSGKGYLSAQLYDALNLALDQLTDDPRSKSVLIVTEGNDYPGGSALKQIVSRAQRLQAHCNIALVADHTFYGTKSMQRYGFYLRRLAGKTQGRYVEVDGHEKEVPHSVDQLKKAFAKKAEGNTKDPR